MLQQDDQKEKSFTEEIQDELSFGDSVQSKNKDLPPHAEMASFQTKFFHQWSQFKSQALRFFCFLGSQGKQALAWMHQQWVQGGAARKRLLIFSGIILILITGLINWLIHSVVHERGRAHFSEVKNLAQALYHPLSRPLVVRFDDRGMFSLIRVKLSFLVRDERVANTLNQLDADLKEAFVLILAKGNSDKLLSMKGKEELLKTCLEITKKTIKDRKLESTGAVESVLLQEFMMQ